MSAAPAFRRIVLKLSGEGLSVHGVTGAVRAGAEPAVRLRRRLGEIVR